jgi:hypothetical protein
MSAEPFAVFKPGVNGHGSREVLWRVNSVPT